MTPNVGQFDRFLRAALGSGALYLGFFSGYSVFETGLVPYGLGLFGTVMLIVAATRVCPLYALFGVKTCEV